MKGILIHGAAAVGLFTSAMVGMLAATGRLNHEGTQGIPLISMLFPAPPEEVEGEGDGSAEGEGGAEGDQGHGGGGEAETQDDAHSESDAGASTDPSRPKRLHEGRSIFNQEPAPASDGHGGGEDEAAGGHGSEPAAGHGGEPAAADPHAQGGGGSSASHAKDPSKSLETPQEKDFRHLVTAVSRGDDYRYRAGGYFRFDGMPAGLTPEELNESWRKVEEVRKELGARADALDVHEKELRAIEQDVRHRQADLGKLRTELETMQRQLDDRIEKFHQQVKLIANDEVASLKRNGQILAAFEPSKSAELVQEAWQSETDRDRILKTLEVMDKDAANAILAELPNALVRDVLEKRLNVTRERSETGSK